MIKIGIRHEDKYLLEKRVAITPAHIKELKKQFEIEFYVQKSAKRIFKDVEFEKEGAILCDTLPDDLNAIFGVKEMPIDFFEDKKTYIFFSHTIKGQQYNMDMLRQMMNKKINLIEYEKIANDKGQRLIFFGRFAGLAGSINSFWSIGKRWAMKGIKNPFEVLNQAYRYNSLEEATHQFQEIAKNITKDGIPAEVGPLVIGITGYGNVSKGAQEMIDLLPVKELSPEELLSTDLKSLDLHYIYKVVFKEEHLSKPKDENATFDLQHYYQHPEVYVNQFDQYIPKLNMLLNCMYWDPNYPRIITKDKLQELWETGVQRPEVIGDITCDPNGSIESTHKGTLIQDPVFVYDPLKQKADMGFEGEGILTMAVDILPSELPREASQAFGDALFPFIFDLASADFNCSFEDLKLPPEIKSALILHQGELTPNYRYMEQYLIQTHK